MPVKLTNLELDLLRKLVNGEAVSLSSQLRLRLEMAGVLRDGAAGIVVTDAAGAWRNKSRSRSPPTARTRARRSRAMAAAGDCLFSADRYSDRARRSGYAGAAGPDTTRHSPGGRCQPVPAATGGRWCRTAAAPARNSTAQQVGPT